MEQAMRKVWDQLKLKPWDYQIARLGEAQGLSWDAAREAVVMEWMRAGNFDPLLAMIKESRIGVRHGPVLNLLVKMIESGQLTLQRGNGRPLDPEAAARDKFVADTYEDCRTDPELKEVRSEDLFRSVGSISGVGEDSVRQAVTDKRKRKS
jgi:hypothetical protein